MTYKIYSCPLWPSATGRDRGCLSHNSTQVSSHDRHTATPCQRDVPKTNLIPHRWIAIATTVLLPGIKMASSMTNDATARARQDIIVLELFSPLRKEEIARFYYYWNHTQAWGFKPSLVSQECHSKTMATYTMPTAKLDHSKCLRFQQHELSNREMDVRGFLINKPSTLLHPACLLNHALH